MCLLAASVPIATAKCVLPVPGDPTNKILLDDSINLKLAKSSIWFLISKFDNQNQIPQLFVYNKILIF